MAPGAAVVDRDAFPAPADAAAVAVAREHGFSLAGEPVARAAAGSVAAAAQSSQLGLAPAGGAEQALLGRRSRVRPALNSRRAPLAGG